MNIASGLAVYFLFFVGIAFLALPFGVRTDEEVGAETIAGQADSAPHRFDLRRHLLRSALIAGLLYGLFVVNGYYGWITAEDLDFYN